MAVPFFLEEFNMSKPNTTAARAVAPQVDQKQPVENPLPDTAHAEVPTAPSPTGKKIKVKTTGDFHIMDPMSRLFIDASDEGTEVTENQFILDKLEEKQLVRA